MIFQRIFVLAAILFLSAQAQAATFVIDPDYTTVGFRIKHLMGYAHGIIKKYDGKIVLDADNKRLTGLNATLDITSLDTKNADRDEDLKSDRFFDAAKFPQATFVVKKVEEKALIGDLTLKGFTKEVTFDYEFLGTALDQYGRNKCGLRLNGKINRLDFGITYNTKTDDGKFLLGDDVEFKIDVQGIFEK